MSVDLFEIPPSANAAVGMTAIRSKREKEAAAALQGSAIQVFLPPPHFPTCPSAGHSDEAERRRNLENSTLIFFLTDIIINPENENTKEISNRQLQFNRLTRASETARKIKEQLSSEAPTQAAALFLNSRPLNYFILNFVYKTNGITDFKKFNEWK